MNKGSMFLGIRERKSMPLLLLVESQRRKVDYNKKRWLRNYENLTGRTSDFCKQTPA